MVLPGLGNASEDYAPFVAALAGEGGGRHVGTAAVRRIDWLRNAAGVVDVNYWRGTLNPSPTVDWYTSAVHAAVEAALAASPDAERVRIVAHSAGGWLSRVYMEKYGVDRVGRVVTLGSPLRPPPADVPGVIDQTRGILKYVEDNCPGPNDVAFTCVAGRYVEGVEAASPSDPSSWSRFIVGQGYRQVCGRGDVWGDGITPVSHALIDGADAIELEGVYHSPLGADGGRRWYGDVLEQWASAIDA